MQRTSAVGPQPSELGRRKLSATLRRPTVRPRTRDGCRCSTNVSSTVEERPYRAASSMQNQTRASAPEESSALRLRSEV